MIIPSIDLMNGKAVQLVQGNAEKKMVEVDDPIKLAKEFGRYGEIAVIDLDAALGKGNNLELIKKICKVADCRVGGGIRTIESGNDILQAGAKKIIVGTKASPEFLRSFPKDRVIAAIDTKKGFIVEKGWTNKTNKTPEQAVQELESYCGGFLYTIVDKEGLMQGTDLEALRRIKGLTKNKIIAAGGITTKEELKELEDMGMDSQIGMAIYTGKIKLDESFISLLDFEKNKGLIPTIVQNKNKDILMLAYSNKESLKLALNNGKGTYFSRSRNEIWQKGDTSGNPQELLMVRYDCDRDTLLFTVKQKGIACHEGRYSCFSDKEFDFEELYDVLVDRMDNPKENSYTSKIIAADDKIMEKIKEECSEVMNYKDRENLVWEIADLTYFVMVLMAKKGITIDEIRNELSRRRK
jgi:phosphoribosylformimino-5-aminoimidazole carboxamide ribotide isomerase